MLEANIILDIITGALIVIPMGIGMARGLAYILVRFLGWIGALAAGYFLGPTLKGILEGGSVGRWIHSVLMKRFFGIEEGAADADHANVGNADAGGDGTGAGDAGIGDGGAAGVAGDGGSGSGTGDLSDFGISAGDGGLFGGGGSGGIGGGADVASDPAGGLPAILGNALQESIDQTVDNAIELLVNAMESLILTVLSFLLIVVLVRLVLILVIRPISKMRGKNPVSLFNKVMGLVIGSIEGLMLAFLFLAALVLVMQVGSAETAQTIATGLRDSYLAGALYEGNLLLLVFR